MMFDAEVCEVAGDLTYYDVVADSGNTITRGFCSSCGSPIISRLSAYPDIRIVSATSLDDPAAFIPSRVLWHSSAQTWDLIDESLKIYDKGI